MTRMVGMERIKFTARDQWVSLETPYAVAEREDDRADPAFAFHRCLRALNLFLHATLILTRDVRVRTVSSHDLRPVVVIGAKPLTEPWRLLSTMYMHPEAQPESLLTQDKPFTQDELNEALNAIVTNRPFMTTMLWRSWSRRHRVDIDGRCFRLDHQLSDCRRESAFYSTRIECCSLTKE